jgi:hypothetical protein
VPSSDASDEADPPSPRETPAAPSKGDRKKKQQQQNVIELDDEEDDDDAEEEEADEDEDGEDGSDVEMSTQQHEDDAELRAYMRTLDETVTLCPHTQDETTGAVAVHMTDGSII